MSIESTSKCKKKPAAAQVTEKLVRRVLKVVDRGLAGWPGKRPGNLDVESAVCYVLGEPLGNPPSCFSPGLSVVARIINDSRLWQNKASRARGLRRLAVAALGTADALDERLFFQAVSFVVLTRMLPRALRDVALDLPPKHKARLRQAARKCETAATAAAARQAAAPCLKALDWAMQRLIKDFDPAKQGDKAFGTQDALRSVIEAAKYAGELRSDAFRNMKAFRARVVAEQKQWARDRVTWADNFVAWARRYWGEDNPYTLWGKALRKEWSADIKLGRAAEAAQNVADQEVADVPRGLADPSGFAVVSAAEASDRPQQMVEEFAEEVVKILVRMRTAGSDFLYLTR